MTPLERIIAIRTGGDTERCHGVRHQGSYSVAHHTWGVLALLYVLWPDDFPRLAAAALFHDVPEAWVGDIPAPTKKYNSAVKTACDDMERRIFARLNLPFDADLPTEDAAKVYSCDKLDLYLWAKEQVYSGNGHAACVVRELERFFEEKPLWGRAQTLYHEIRKGAVSVEHHTDGLIKELNNGNQ